MSLIAFARKIQEAKAKQSPSGPGPDAKPETVSSSAPPVRIDKESVAKYKITTSLPAGAVVHGNLVLEESLILGGEVCGHVYVKGPGMAAFVKEGAIARNGIKASIVLISGEVYGHVEAEHVRILAGGRLEGIIHARTLTVEEGGILLNETTYIAPPSTASTAGATIDAKVVKPCAFDGRSDLAQVPLTKIQSPQTKEEPGEEE